MSNQFNMPAVENERAKPVCFPYRAEQTTREERYPHVLGDGFRITKIGSDKHRQETFIYEDSDIKFYLIATTYAYFDGDSPSSAVAHSRYYRVTDWLLKSDD